MNVRSLLITVVAAMLTSGALAQTPLRCNWPVARKSLEDMLASDQKDQRQDPERLVESDKENQRRLDGIVASCGWPPLSKVGRLASDAAFLIVQHSDLGNQLRYAPLMQRASEQGELSRQSMALLEDRINIQKGLPQRYGTQVSISHGKTSLFPVAEEATLDQRRAELGLPPICEYLQSFSAQYGPVAYPRCKSPVAKSPH